MTKQRSPVRYGQVPKPALTPDRYYKGSEPQAVPLRGNVNIAYPDKHGSVGGKSVKPGRGVGSTITGSSRRPEEIDRAPASQKSYASIRSDVIRDNPDAGRRSHVSGFDLDYLKAQRQGRAPDQLKGRVMPTEGKIRKAHDEKEGRFTK